MELKLYPRLSTRSRRAMTKTVGRFGRVYYYKPRGTLLQRLSSETGLSIEDVYNQLMKERNYLLRLQPSL